MENKNTEEQNDILKEMDSFTGTEQYHKGSILYDLNLTDGINHLRLKLNCFWLIDIIGSTQNLKEIKENNSFIIWKIKRVGKGFKVTAFKDYDSNKTEEENKEYLLYSQTGEYTDFALNEFEFYQVNNVLLLKSEY